MPSEEPTPETLPSLAAPDAYTTWILPLAWLLGVAATLETHQRGPGPLTSLPLAMALAVVVRVAMAQARFRPLAVFCVATWALAGLVQLWLPFLQYRLSFGALGEVIGLPQLPAVLGILALLGAVAATRSGARVLMGGRIQGDADAHPGLLGVLIVCTPPLLLLGAATSVDFGSLSANLEVAPNGLWGPGLGLDERITRPTSTFGGQLALGAAAVVIALVGAGLGIDRTVAEVRGRLGLSGDLKRSALLGASVGLAAGCVFASIHKAPPVEQTSGFLLGLGLAQVGGELLLRGLLQPATGPLWPGALAIAAAALHADPRLLPAFAVWQIAMAVLRGVSGMPAVLAAPAAAAGIVTVVWTITAGAGGMR